MLNAALELQKQGFSIIPCRENKTPAIKAWKRYQNERATEHVVQRWFDLFDLNRLAGGAGFQSIGVVCGAVSGGLVVVDLDRMMAAKAFYKALPHYAGQTYTVLTGSGNGVHLYFKVKQMPPNMNVRNELGGFELRGEGQYVIAPPSPHPSGRRYIVLRNRPIAEFQNLDDVHAWFQQMREQQNQREHDQLAKAYRDFGGEPLGSERNRAYLEKVFSEEVARAESAPKGQRNSRLFYAGLRLANLAAGGELDWARCESALVAAGERAGLPSHEVTRTVASAWRIGSKHPKRVP